jgi:Zn finger protein HypA/HybF involved in hydrogenase expression
VNDLEKPIATAGAQIQLVTANAYVDFAVIVGNRRICEFRIEERHYQDHRIRDRTLTAGRNHAVMGWTEGPFSKNETRRTSLDSLTCYLAGMGLDVTPVLKRAKERGWPQETIDEAAEAARRAKSEHARVSTIDDAREALVEEYIELALADRTDDVDCSSYATVDRPKRMGQLAELMGEDVADALDVAVERLAQAIGSYASGTPYPGSDVRSEGLIACQECDHVFDIYREYREDCPKCGSHDLGTANGPVQGFLLVASVPGEDVHTLFRVEHIHPTHTQAVETIKATVREWSHTPEGREAVEAASHDFNWGDLTEHASDISFPGVLGLSTVAAGDTVEVYHDEHLFDACLKEANR